MFKVINNIAATIIDNLFTIYHSCNLCSKSKFVVPSVRTVHNGQNSIQLRFPYLEYDSRLYKRFWNFRHIQRQNMKIKDHKLPLLPLQKKQQQTNKNKTNIPNLGFINIHKSPQVRFLIACPNLKSQYQKFFLPLNTNSTHPHIPLLSARGRS